MLGNEKIMDNRKTTPCLCASLRKATRVVTNRYDAFLSPSGLKITQYSMLMNIARNPGITTTELAKVMLMDQTTVTRNLQLLQKKGCISFQEEGKDLRTKQIQISQAGKQMIEQAKPLWEQAQRDIKNDLGDLGFDVIIRSLISLVE
jgi:MarR family transcriptional regulator, organic hydroperoxide resistance regulator